MRRLLLAAAAGLAVTMTAKAAVPSEVTMDGGRLAGTAGASADVRVFKGMPFAAAEQRRPQLPSEDCLYLNVWTTAEDSYQQLLKGGANP